MADQSSNESFDPYHKWLGISPKEQPPHHYRLLGLNTFENDGDVIEAAANRQSAFLRQYATGPHGEYSQKLLNEVSAAQICLLVPEQKAEYDKKLRDKIAAHKAKSKAADVPLKAELKPDEKTESVFKDEDDDQGGTYAIEKSSAKKPRVAGQPSSKKMSEADIQSFYRLSQQCIEKHDYSQAVELLQDIPRSQRSKNVQTLYEKAVRLEQQAEELNVEMNDAFELEDYEKALASAKRLIKLKPGHRRAREIAREIMQDGLLKRRTRQGPRARRKGGLPPAVIKLAVASLVIGGIVWGGMQLASRSGAGGGDDIEKEIAEFGKVRVRADDAFRKANFTLLVDKKDVALADLEDGIELTAGPHTLEVKDGTRVVRTEKFSIDPENEPVISLTYASGSVAGSAVVELDDEVLRLPDGQVGEVRVFNGHEREVLGLAFSPSGRFLMSGGNDQTARLWNVETGAEIRAFRPGYYVSSVAFSPDGKWVAMNGDRGNSFHVWDLKTGLALKEFAGHPGPVMSLAYSPDGKTIVAASGRQRAGTVRLWDAVTGSEKWSYAVHGQSANSVSFSADGKQILAVVDNIVVTLDAATGERLKIFDGSAPASFSADGSVVLTKGNSQSPQLWNAHTGVELRLLTDVTYLNRAAFSTKSPIAALTSNRNDNSISLYDTVNGEKLATFEGHSGYIYSLAFSPDGRFLASGSRDKTIRLWRLPKAAGDGSIKFESLPTTPTPLAESPVGEVRSIQAAASNSGVSAAGHLVAATHGGFARVWDINTGALAFKSTNHNATRAVLSHDGRYVVSADGASLLRVWDVSTGRELQRIALPGTSVADLSPTLDNGRLLATVRLDRNVASTVALLVDLTTGNVVQQIPPAGTVGIRTAAITADGQRVAAVDWSQRSVRIFNAATGDVENTVSLVADEKARDIVGAQMEFAGDGQRLVITGADRVVRLIDVGTGKLTGTMPLDATAYGLDLSPNGNSILTCGSGVRLLNVDTNRTTPLFEEDAKDVRSIQFIPGGEYAVTTGNDYALRVWKLPEESAWPTEGGTPSGQELEFSVTQGDVRRIQAHERDVRRIVFSPDGLSLATISSSDANIRLWNVSLGNEQKALNTNQGGVGAVAFVPGGSLISGQTASQNSGSIIDWELSSGNKTVWSKGHSNPISDLAVSPDGKLLFTASARDSGSLRMWDIARGEEMWRFEMTLQSASSLAFTPDGSKGLAEIDGVVMLFDATNGQRLQLFDGTGPARLSPDGRFVVTSGPDTLRMWDVEDGREIQRFRGFSKVPVGIAFSPDGRHLVTGEDDRLALRLWDVKSGRQLAQRLSGEDGMVTTVAFAPNDDLVAYGTREGIVALWKLPEMEEIAEVAGDVIARPQTIATDAAEESVSGKLGQIVLPGSQPSAPVLSGDAKFVAVIQNSVAKVWNLETGAFVFKSAAERYRPEGVAVAPDAAFVVTRSAAGINRWDVATGRRSVFAPITKTRGMTLSPAGKRLLVFTGSRQQAVIADVYDIASREKTHTISIQSSGRYPRARFSPDGALIAIVDGRSVRLIDAETGAERRVLSGNQRDVYAGPVFSHDGQFIYTYSDRVVQTWSVSDGKLQRTSDSVSANTIALGPNGTFLVPWPTGLKLYRSSSAEEYATIDAELSTTTRFLYVPGTKFAVSTGYDNAVRTWRLPTRRGRTR